VQSAIRAIEESGMEDPYNVDMIIAADVIYTEEGLPLFHAYKRRLDTNKPFFTITTQAVPMLLRTLYTLSSGKEKEIILAGEHHNPRSYELFFKLVGDFFEISEIEPQYHHPEFCIHPHVQLWKLKRKQSPPPPPSGSEQQT